MAEAIVVLVAAAVRVLVGVETAVDNGVVLVVTAAGDGGGCEGGREQCWWL